MWPASGSTSSRDLVVTDLSGIDVRVNLDGDSKIESPDKEITVDGAIDGRGRALTIKSAAGEIHLKQGAGLAASTLKTLNLEARNVSLGGDIHARETIETTADQITLANPTASAPPLVAQTFLVKSHGGHAVTMKGNIVAATHERDSLTIETIAGGTQGDITLEGSVGNATHAFAEVTLKGAKLTQGSSLTPLADITSSGDIDVQADIDHFQGSLRSTKGAVRLTGDASAIAGDLEAMRDITVNGPLTDLGGNITSHQGNVKITGAVSNPGRANKLAITAYDKITLQGGVETIGEQVYDLTNHGNATRSIELKGTLSTLHAPITFRDPVRLIGDLNVQSATAGAVAAGGRVRFDSDVIGPAWDMNVEAGNANIDLGSAGAPVEQVRVANLELTTNGPSSFINVYADVDTTGGNQTYNALGPGVIRTSGTMGGTVNFLGNTYIYDQLRVNGLLLLDQAAANGLAGKNAVLGGVGGKVTAGTTRSDVTLNLSGGSYVIGEIGFVGSIPSTTPGVFQDNSFKSIEINNAELVRGGGSGAIRVREELAIRNSKVDMGEVMFSDPTDPQRNVDIDNSLRPYQSVTLEGVRDARSITARNANELKIGGAISGAEDVTLSGIDQAFFGAVEAARLSANAVGVLSFSSGVVGVGDFSASGIQRQLSIPGDLQAGKAAVTGAAGAGFNFGNVTVASDVKVEGFGSVTGKSFTSSGKVKIKAEGSVAIDDVKGGSEVFLQAGTFDRGVARGSIVFKTVENTVPDDYGGVILAGNVNAPDGVVKAHLYYVAGESSLLARHGSVVNGIPGMETAQAGQYLSDHPVYGTASGGVGRDTFKTLKQLGLIEGGRIAKNHYINNCRLTEVCGIFLGWNPPNFGFGSGLLNLGSALSLDDQAEGVIEVQSVADQDEEDEEERAKNYPSAGNEDIW